MRRISLGVVVLAALFAARFALPTPGEGITQLLHPQGLFDEFYAESVTGGHKVELKTEGKSDVYVVHNTFAVGGGHSGWHTHPGPSLITVTAGTIWAYDSHCGTPQVYSTGMGFVDPGGEHVHLLRNEDPYVRAETVAVQILPKDAARRIDISPAPCSLPPLP